MILLIEDNTTLAEALEYSFKQNNYELAIVKNIFEAKAFLSQHKPELVILDIMLPDGSGLHLFRDFLKDKHYPTIFLTARDDEETIVEGLELGAEDYITKPFSTKELFARINKVLMRQKKNTIIEVQNIKFDLDKMVVYRDDTIIDLSSLELKILHLLFTNLNRVVTRDFIIEKIWEWTGNDVNDNTVTVYIKRIREKLDTNIIITLKGIGYRIDEE